MGERIWTPQQRSAIDAAGGTLLVSAAAGSGAGVSTTGSSTFTFGSSAAGFSLNLLPITDSLFPVSRPP